MSRDDLDDVIARNRPTMQYIWRGSSALGASRFRVVEKEGKLRVVRQQPVNDIDAHWWNRLAALVGG